MKPAIGETVVEPTMAEQDIFLRWVTLIGDSSAVWNPEFYGTTRSNGTIFGRPADIHYVYTLGNSYAEIHVAPQGDDPETQVTIKIFGQRLQGIRVHVLHGPGEIDVTDEKLVGRVFQVYGLDDLVNYVKEQVS